MLLVEQPLGRGQRHLFVGVGRRELCSSLLCVVFSSRVFARSVKERKSEHIASILHSIVYLLVREAGHCGFHFCIVFPCSQRTACVYHASMQPTSALNLSPALLFLQFIFDSSYIERIRCGLLHVLNNEGLLIVLHQSRGFHLRLIVVKAQVHHLPGLQSAR